MRYLASLVILLSSVLAQGKTELLSLDMTTEGDKAYFHFDFSEPVGNTEITANFIRRTIEWDMKDFFIRKDKKFLTLDKDEFKNIYISHKDADYLRLRLNLMPSELASAYHNRVSFVKKSKRLTLVIDKGVKLAKEKLDEFSRVYDIVTDIRDSKLAAHLEARSEMIASDEGSEEDIALAAEAANGKEIDISGKTEEEIPLNLKKSTTAESTSNPFMRLIIGLGVLGLLLASIYLVSKKLNGKRMGAAFNHDSIKVVSQKYLGPKKTLTLIRVAGEYILIGVTDHNINHIKTLSLVDDELPALEPNEFGSAVKDLVEKDKKQDRETDLNTDEVEDSFTISSLDDVKQLMNDERI